MLLFMNLLFLIGRSKSTLMVLYRVKKKLLMGVFLVLSLLSSVGRADDEKIIYFHVHPEGVGEKRLAVKYVLCQGSDETISCLDPAVNSYFLPGSGTGSIKILTKPGYAIIVTSLEMEGKKIWGAYAADYAENGCHTDRKHDSLSFFLNKSEPKSVTCFSGVG